MTTPDKDDRWTIQQLLTWTQSYFECQQVQSPRLDAELLLADALNVQRIFLYTNFDKPLSPDERSAFRAHVKRRAAGEPVAYILGSREFYGLEFEVNRAVLIPRPETEHLVDAALEWLRSLGASRSDFHGDVLDIGTGSGAVAVSLASELASLRVHATDISAAALAIAQRNATRHQVAQRITFAQGSLFEPVAARRFDAIVSNPPYVETTVRESLQREVRQFEPEQALFAGADGLAIIRPLVAAAPGYLLTPGLLAIEIGAGQSSAVERLFAQAGFGAVRSIADLQGHRRVVLGEI